MLKLYTLSIKKVIVHTQGIRNISNFIEKKIQKLER